MEFQLQHQSFQWTSRTDLLLDGLVGSLCGPRDSNDLHLFPRQTIQHSDPSLCLLCKYPNNVYLVCILSHFDWEQLFMPPWTVTRQDPQSIRFSRQEYWRGLSFPPAEDFPDPEMEFMSLMYSALAGRFLTISATWKALTVYKLYINYKLYMNYLLFWSS